MYYTLQIDFLFVLALGQSLNLGYSISKFSKSAIEYDCKTLKCFSEQYDERNFAELKTTIVNDMMINLPNFKQGEIVTLYFQHIYIFMNCYYS